jgi:hypothetical protein
MNVILSCSVLHYSPQGSLRSMPKRFLMAMLIQVQECLKDIAWLPRQGFSQIHVADSPAEVVATGARSRTPCSPELDAAPVSMPVDDPAAGASV